jgi:hypothetical protein
MSAASDLLALQELDLARDGVLTRLQQIEEELEESEELKAAREDLEEKTSVLDSLKRRQSDLELEVEEVRAKAAEVEAKLYSGKVTSPKELSDLDLDLKSIRAQAAKREDVLLSQLVEVEEAEKVRSESASEYGRVEGSWREHHDELLQEQARLKPEAEGLTTRRDAAASAIDPRSKSLYSLLRERKNGVAVARVERGMCQGCRITLPAAVLTKARGTSGLVQCVSCERILLVS